MTPKSAKEFEEGKKAGAMKLEEHMVVGNGYTIRELEKMTGRTYTRISFKLKELKGENKAESRVIDHVTYWRLKTSAYLEGTVKERKKKKNNRGPGRPSIWYLGS